MAADSSSTVSQADAHSLALASSHCFLASAMACSRADRLFSLASCRHNARVKGYSDLSVDTWTDQRTYVDFLDINHCLLHVVNGCQQLLYGGMMAVVTTTGVMPWVTPVVVMHNPFETDHAVILNGYKGLRKGHSVK